MKIKLGGKEIESDVYVFASDGIWIWKNGEWSERIPYMDRKDFCEKSKKQFEQHPDYLDLDKLFSQP